MLFKYCAIASVAIAIFAILAAYTQSSALSLREENQATYWPRHGTQLSGSYRGGGWQPSAIRSSYGSFQGGGVGSGK
jgi:hypothetical protein